MSLPYIVGVRRKRQNAGGGDHMGRRHSWWALVVARPSTNLAAEDPIGPRRIPNDDRQEEQRADEEKGLRAGCGGRIPETDGMRDDVWPQADREADIAHREQGDGAEKRQKFSATVN